MLNFKKNYKKLYKSYKKRLKTTSSSLIDTWQDPTEYFVTYLRMIRDYRLLTTTYLNEIDKKDKELTALIAAISEYEKSQSCFSNYYQIENNVVSRKSGISEEEALAAYSQEKLFHWEAFWNIVKMNVEDWVAQC